MARRSALLKIQGAARAYTIRRHYLRVKTSARTIQAFIRICNQKLKWTRLRRGLRTLHSLSRGFIVRQHVLRMLLAIKTLQMFVISVFRRFASLQGSYRVETLTTNRSRASRHLFRA